MTLFTIDHQGHYVHLIKNYWYSPAAILKHIGSELSLDCPKTVEYPPIKYKVLQVSRIF